MSDTVIKVENLSKSYTIRHQNGERYTALRDVVSNGVKSMGNRLLGRTNGQTDITREEFWALDDVSFEVKQGERVGIIGRNGAGKSTLLKILSRITEPTKGRVHIKGRVASLLEVGTGFHPELTGRENIYLNGAILGMSRGEIRCKFDEIVSFAEVEKFLDTPVKRYSSGMYVRLAFGVAVHLEPEILLVDEVLAVGDAQFQKKCLQKMQSVTEGGKTILFVSHNMASVRDICQKAVTIHQGKVVGAGPVNELVDQYLANTANHNLVPSVIETESFKIDDVQIHSLIGSVIKTFDRVIVRVKVTPKLTIQEPGLYVGFHTYEGQRLAGIDIRDFSELPPHTAGRQLDIGFTIDDFPFLPGNYQVELHLKDLFTHKFEFVTHRFDFEVAEMPIYGGRKLDSWFGHTVLKAQPFINK